MSSVTNTIVFYLDSTFLNSPISFIMQYPNGTRQRSNPPSLFYSHRSKLVYDNYLIYDQGSIAAASEFSGAPTSAEYKEELQQWNYQQSFTSTEMGSRSIRLVIDPRIGTKSGLIQ